MKKFYTFPFYLIEPVKKSERVLFPLFLYVSPLIWSVFFPAGNRTTGTSARLRGNLGAIERTVWILYTRPFFLALSLF